MLPIRDLNPTRSWPALTYGLIAVNLAVFVYQLSLGPDGMEGFIERYGVIPALLTDPANSGSWVTPLTSMFMHGGWLHILGNMWFLHVFGDNVEDELGHGRYLLFYLVCGLAAAISQVAADPDSVVPMVGASGAVAGVLGGYIRLHPRARILTLVPIFIFIQFIEISAWFFIFVWFAMQLLMGLSSLSMAGTGQGGVAFFAHIGGFVAGFLLVGFVKRKPNPTAGWRVAR